MDLKQNEIPEDTRRVGLLSHRNTVQDLKDSWWNSHPREGVEGGEQEEQKKNRRGDGNWWGEGVGCPPLSFNPTNSLD